jgi:hypothetical protein
MRKIFNRENKQQHLLWIVVALLLAGFIRGLFLWRSNYRIDSDEAIVGLMAKHILAGQSYPIFYYGQHYMGSLEAILTSFVFAIFGQSNFSLKLVPTLSLLVLIPVSYFLTLRFSNQLGARIAALYLALSPLSLVEWSTKARGGFIELILIGSISLLIAVDILRSKIISAFDVAVMAFLLGLGWWTNNQIVFYMVPIFLVFLFVLPFRFGIVNSFKTLITGTFFFFLGGAPFWYYNLFSEPRFETFKQLGGRATFEEFKRFLINYFSESLPILLGAKRFWSNDFVFEYSAEALYGVVALTALAVFILLFFQGFSKKNRQGFGIIVIFLITTPLIFASSSFGSLSLAPRYLLPLYSIFPVLFGISISYFLSLSSIISKLFSYFLLLSILVLNLTSNYLGRNSELKIVIPGEPFIAYGERVSADHAELYSWLKENNFRHVRTNYWVGYRMAFETNEEILFSIYGEPETLRIPNYEMSATPDAPYVLAHAEGEELKRALGNRGFIFSEKILNDYTVIYQVAPMAADLERVVGLKTSASFNSEQSYKLADQDLGTRWGSGEPRKLGMSVRLEIPKDQPKDQIVAGIKLQQGFWPQDAAKQLLIIGELSTGEKCVIFRGATSGRFGKESWNNTFYFPPTSFRYIEVIADDAHPVFDWSLAEVELFRPN